MAMGDFLFIWLLLMVGGCTHECKLYPEHKLQATSDHVMLRNAALVRD